MQKITWQGPRALMEAAAALLPELTQHAVALTRIDKPMEDDDDGVWALEVYCDNAEDATDAATLSALIATSLSDWPPDGEAQTETLPDIDWVAHALEGLGIVRAGRFALYGVHDEARIPQDDGVIPIRIDANQAFGTGHHPTTAGCLELLDRLAGFAPHAVLDLGCGSAVLAIAAAKMWGRAVLASDIDERSVEIARENVSLNGVASLVEVVIADGFDHPSIFDEAPFDFIFANILAGPLIAFAPAMAAHCARSGRVMLAGLMAEQENSVRAAYENAGFRLLNRLPHQVWPVLLFARV